MSEVRLSGGSQFSSRGRPDGPPQATVKSSRWGGFFLALFFTPFLTIGLFFTIGPIYGRVTGHGGFQSNSWAATILASLFGSIFALVGLLGVIGGVRVMMGLSATSRKPGRPKEGSGSNWMDHPRFPKYRKIRPGPRGGVLLAPEMTPGGSFVTSAIFCLIWNGITWGAIVAMYGDGVFKEGFGWCAGLLLLLFAVIGALLLYHTAHQFFRVVLVGSTLVEIAREPLRPGERTRAHFYQSGSFSITSIRAVLKCREIARYRVGTNTTTVEEDVHDEPVLTVENVQAKGLHASTADFEFTIPADAMHSFDATNNDIKWFLELIVDIPGKPDVKEKHYFRVAPK